jgi:hypothetical protein
MPEFSEEDIERGLDCYDPENRIFPRFSDEATRGDLSAEDVLLILKWKLGRIKRLNESTISEANLKKINCAIKQARKLEHAETALQCLTSITGIGLAAATAILTLCYPTQFTIIDRRVLEVLKLRPRRKAKSRHTQHQKRRTYTTDAWSVQDYIELYLPAVKKQRDEWKRDLRQTDRALWGISVNGDVKKLVALRLRAKRHDQK